MKKVLLIPVAILALCVAGILVSESLKPSDDNNNTITDNSDDTVKQIPEGEILKFKEEIKDYFALLHEEEATFKRMGIYPIKASADYLANHDDLGNYLNLKEALASKAVRILEKGGGSNIAINRSNPIMPGGSLMDMPIEQQEAGQAYSGGATVNTLTIENTSNDTVYIMAGDVVQGGLQDRVIAQDMIIPPHSGLQDIPVFCVESNRWSQRENTPTNNTSKSSDGIYAFTGYFNVASNSVRYAAKFEKNQQEVWNEVGHITSKHQAQTSTNTYGALSQSKGFIKERDEYLQYFGNYFDNRDEIVGVIVVSGDKVMACDMFATPELFKKQYDLLLHSYVTDALTYGGNVSISGEQVDTYFNTQVVSNYFNNSEDVEQEKAAKFVQNQRIIHFTDLETK